MSWLSIAINNAGLWKTIKTSLNNNLSMSLNILNNEFYKLLLFFNYIYKKWLNSI